jgi:hypothetical protein
MVTHLLIVLLPLLWLALMALVVSACRAAARADAGGASAEQARELEREGAAGMSHIGRVACN